MGYFKEYKTGKIPQSYSAYFNNLDIYYYPEYLRLSELAGEGEGIWLYYKNKGGEVIYPFLRKKIPEELQRTKKLIDYYDISSPYGYSGPYFIKKDNDYSSLAKEFCIDFQRYCQDRSIISEFVRFHPLLKTQNNFYPQKYVNFNNLIIYVDLTQKKEDIYKNLADKTRRNIKKAERLGLEVIIDNDFQYLSEFKKLYTETMQKLKAEDFYYFNDDYFSFIKKKFKKFSFLAVVKKQKKVLASALFFAFGKFVTYHLGGSDYYSLNLRPNDLLFYKISLWAKENSFKFLNMGGGYKDGDSLFKFKSSFSKTVAPFYCGRIVHNEERYEFLKHLRQKLSKRHKEEIKKDFFPVYRN